VTRWNSLRADSLTLLDCERPQSCILSFGATISFQKRGQCPPISPAHSPAARSVDRTGEIASLHPGAPGETRLRTGPGKHKTGVVPHSTVATLSTRRRCGRLSS
jgi:hypothetical protein